MIDFISINIHGDVSDLQNAVIDSGKFQITGESNNVTSKLNYPITAKYNNITVIIRKEYNANIRMSLHKLYNEMESNVSQNYNDFTYSNLIKTLNIVKGLLPSVSNESITKLEFGLNIKVSNDASEIIDNNILLFKLKAHNEHNRYKSKGNLKRYTFSQFDLKLYDKQKQKQLPYKLLRYEIAIKNKAALFNLGVKNLNSLADKGILKKLFEETLKRYEELLIVDDFDKVVNKLDKNELYKYTNPLYWNRQRKRKVSSTISYQKKKLGKLLLKYKLLTIKDTLRQEILKKFNFLMNN